MDLEKALADISAIRSDVARNTAFHGYGPAIVAVTGVLALAAAALQPWALKGVSDPLTAYLILWTATAAVCAMAVAVDTVLRALRLHAGFAGEMVQSAFEHFAPAAVSAALLTFVLYEFAPGSTWLLPGLWQIFFALGIFASYRFLPRILFGVGGWYLLTGLICIAFIPPASAFTPWTMGLPFGVGQFLMALALWRGARRTS